MKLKSKKKEIQARHLKCGDLIFSPRTHQLMFVISSISKEDVVKISWLSLDVISKKMKADVNPLQIYYLISPTSST